MSRINRHRLTWLQWFMFLTCFAVAPSEATTLSEIYSMSLTMDGSVEPPGDRIDIATLLFARVQDAKIEVRAFTINQDDRRDQKQVAATGKRNVDAEGNFLLSAVLRQSGESIKATPATNEVDENAEPVAMRFDRALNIPYEDLAISQGEHFLGYDVRLVVDGHLVEIRPTVLTVVTVSDKVRTEMMRSAVETDLREETRTIEAMAWQDDRLVSKAWQRTMAAYMPPRAIRTDTNIPGEFRRESLAGQTDGHSSKEFVPETRRTIFFATNRDSELPGGDADTRFSNESVFARDKMIYGSCRVSIPINNHRPGKVEVPGRIWYFWAEPPDPQKHFLVEHFDTSLKRDGFLKALGEDDILVYVHGYNNTFKDAILRAAQVQHDVEFAGKLVVFSWPSAGSMLVAVNNPFDGTKRAVEIAYRHDEELAERSFPFLAELLNQLLEAQSATNRRGKVHVVAHSMGNRVFLKALFDLRAQAKVAKDGPKLGEVVLAAADIDGSTFANVRTALLQSCERVTYYYASDDGALLVSRTLHQDKPIGLGPLFDPMKIDTISAEKLTGVFNKLGHLYITESKPILTDLRILLALELPPLQRRPPLGPRVEAPDLSGCFYWTFPSPR
jgi:esterase/lipase superfamily enzyme